MNEIRVGDTVRVEKTEGYVSPLSMVDYPKSFKSVLPSVEHTEFEGLTGKVIEIRNFDIYPDRVRYVIWFDSIKDKVWYPIWWIKKVNAE